MICPQCDTENLQGVDQCAFCSCDLSDYDKPAPRDRIERCLMQETVSELCPNEGVRVVASTTIADAIQTLLQNDIGALLVVDEEDSLIGIFSERDLLRKVAGQIEDYAERPVEEFMTPDPVCVELSHTLARALHLMDVRGYRHLPVLENNRLIGMISVRDMLRYITELCG